MIIGSDANSFDSVDPYVNQTTKDASERKLRAILAKLDPAATARSRIPRRSRQPSGAARMLAKKKRGS